MNSDVSMKNYYAQRAPVYDRVYHIAERQEDLRILEKRVPAFFSGRNVLEIACGTGYWTELIAPMAKQYTATDFNAETIEFARRRSGVEKVKFLVEDAYHLSEGLNGFDGAFAGLWFSHVPRERWQDFILELHRHLAADAIVVLLDNSERQCRDIPVAHTDAQGNTWQKRKLDDGSEHQVVKNFPTEDELDGLIKEIGVKVEYKIFDHFWLFTYQRK